MKKNQILVILVLVATIAILSGCGKTTGKSAGETSNCTSVCSSGVKQCLNYNTSQTCGDYNSDGCFEWNAGTICQFGCTNGACNPCYSICSPADYLTCNGVNIVSCRDSNSDGCLEWSIINNCPYGCFNGTCLPPCTDECTAGSKKCDGNYLRPCGNYDSDTCLEYNSMVGTLCPAGCANGACYPTGTIYATSTPTGATIYVDGVSKGATPRTINGVAPGSRVVKFSLTNYADVTQNVAVTAGQTTNVAATLTAIPGSIYATSTPSGARVYVDGVNKGATPRTITGVAPGIRQVMFTLTNYRTVTQNATLTAGQKTTVTATLIHI